MKRMMLGILALVCIFSLCGCAANLPEGFDEQKALEAAQTTLEKINAGDFAAVTGELREDLQDSITAGELEQAWGEQLKEFGSFTEIKDYAMQGTKDQSGEEYAVVVLACAYENGTAIYTLSYDLNYELVGLYMK